MSGDARPGTTASFDALLDAAVDGIVVIDHEGCLLRFSAAAEGMFGYREHEVLGRNVALLMTDSDRHAHDDYIERHRRTGHTAIIGVGREVMGRHRDGREFPIHLSVGEVRGEHQAAYVGIVRDLTERREVERNLHELEQRLAHADRLVTLGELTAGIAHEINQPLTAISAFADAGHRMLENGDPEAIAEASRTCRRISEQARRAAEVVGRLRRLARRGHVQKERVDVDDLVRKTLQLFEIQAKRLGLAVFWRPPPTPLEVNADEIQLQQVIVNLVNNAADALSAAGVPGGEVLIDAGVSDGAVRIRVQDNGPGLDEEIRGRLFEPFFTTKPDGVGLGLSICRNIARAHGGDLTYRQREEGGARFELSLPLEHIG